MVGGGSLPTVGTSNVTLTIAALCLRSARAMLTQLDTDQAPIRLTADGAMQTQLEEVSA
jgi:choline dehydrogenase-like flavoprotein